MSTDIVRLPIHDYDALGKLVKTWALKEDRVNNGKAYLPQPKTLHEFCTMLVNANATSHDAIKIWLNSFQGTMTDFEMVQSTPNKLVVRLPMAEMLRQMESNLGEGYNYPLAYFYSPRFFSNAPQHVTNPIKANNERVGDCTISQCD